MPDETDSKTNIPDNNRADPKTQNYILKSQIWNNQSILRLGKWF